MVINILFIIIGTTALVYGAKAFVLGSSSLARRLKISPLIIGMTLVALGTSAPEMFFSSMASFRGESALALGNVLGSNLVNVLLIIGISAYLGTLSFRKQVIRLELPFLLLAYSVIWLLPESREIIGQRDGWVLIILGLAFFLFLIKRKKTLLSHDSGGKDYPGWQSAVLIIAGLSALVVGSKLLIDGASGFALAIGISEALVALSVVAIGTSLPELATSAVAAYHNHDDIAIGNIIGSNIINTCFVLGTAAAISPISFSPEIHFDLAFNIFSILALLSILAIGHRKIGRKGGLILIALYAFYFSYIIIRG